MSAFKLKRVNHIGIPIRDRRRSLPFYRDLLGLEIIPSLAGGDHIVWTRMGDGAMVHLIESEGKGMEGFHVAFEVDDFDAALTALRAQGHPIDSLGERADGQRYLFVRDPDGNRVELTTPSNLRPINRIVDAWGYTREA